MAIDFDTAHAEFETYANSALSGAGVARDKLQDSLNQLGHAWWHAAPDQQCTAGAQMQAALTTAQELGLDKPRFVAATRQLG